MLGFFEILVTWGGATCTKPSLTADTTNIIEMLRQRRERLWRDWQAVREQMEDAVWNPPKESYYGLHYWIAEGQHDYDSTTERHFV